MTLVKTIKIKYALYYKVIQVYNCVQFMNATLDQNIHAVKDGKNWKILLT